MAVDLENVFVSARFDNAPPAASDQSSLHLLALRSDWDEWTAQLGKIIDRVATCPATQTNPP